MCSMISLKSFFKDVSLKNYCTFNIGGNAKYLYVAHSTKQLINVCYFCERHNIKYKVIGCGANLLFSDEGFNGAIIVNKTQKIKLKKNLVVCESGVNLTKLIYLLKDKNLGGFESLASIPATVGGAVVNSLSAFDINLSDLVLSVECVHKNDIKKKLILSNSECSFDYRNSIFKNENYIITKVVLKVENRDKNLIEDNINLAVNKKLNSQPVGELSAGSVFKRCSIIPAKVIDELGLKGTCFGGAKVSEKHAGFIVNIGNATCLDVLQLINFIKQRVFEATGESIETEIEYVDF